MEDKIKIYEIGEDSELLAISLVEYPAVETSFIALKNEKPRFITLEQDDKRIVYGCALRANFPIYRYDGVNEYYIKFTPSAIEKMSRDYLIKKEDNWTLDHMEDTNGIQIVESWIKQDEKFDKSIALGLEDIEVGSWFIGAYVSNEDTWKKIKEGTWSGFSVEAMCQFVEQKFNNNMKNENLEQVEINETFWDRLKSIIAEALKMPATEEKEAEVAADEVVEEVKEEVKEEEVPEVKEDVEVVEEMAAEEKPAEEVIEEPKEEVILEKEDTAKIEELGKAIKELKDKLAEKDVKIEEMSKQIEKMSKQPSTEPVKVEAKKNDAPNWLDYASGRIKF